jgi:site-specific DNA recombinase
MRPKGKSTAAAKDRLTIGYSRVSTEDQAREGVSLDAQEAKLAAYAVAMGYEIADMVRDAGESAKSLDRPGMVRIIAAVRRGEVKRLIVCKLDRLTRSVVDLKNLISLCNEHDVSLISLNETIDTGSAAGRMLVSMLALVSEWERESTVERTAAALGHMRRQRQVYGSTPFGYSREGDRLVENAGEQAALAEMRRMDDAEKSFAAIADMLNTKGIKPHRAATWYPSSVRAVLRSKMTTETKAA